MRVSNSLAIGMYEKFGYSVYRRVLGYYSSDHDGEDAFGSFTRISCTLCYLVHPDLRVAITSADMRKALPRDVDKKSIIPLPHPITPDQL